MTETSLHTLVNDLAPRVRRVQPFWWSMLAGRRPRCVAHGDAGRCERLCAAAVAAALMADRGDAGEASRDWSVDAGWHARQVREWLRRGPPRLWQIADDVAGPREALAVYLAAMMTIDGSRASGRVWLEDLAEALLMPPTLIRWLRQAAGQVRPAVESAEA